MRLVHLLKVVSRYLPLSNTLKRSLCALRGLVYQRRAKCYRKSAKRLFPDLKVLVVMDAGIGNAVETTPLVQAIRILWPKAEITILPPAGDLFDDWCVVDYVAKSADDLKGRSFTHTFGGSSRSIGECKKCCDLGNVHHVKEMLLGGEFLKPEREYKLDMLRSLGYKGFTPPLYVSLCKPDELIPSSPLRISLVPGGKPDNEWRNKRWPYFGQLGLRLLEAYPSAHLLLIGTKDDPVPTELCSQSRVLDLRGRLTLKETAWILRRSHVAIGNDCGPMHIADAVQAPSVILFGPTCEVKNGPLYKSLTIRDKSPCAPCQYDKKLLLTCNNPTCMTRLHPDIVLKGVEGLIRT